MQNHHKKAKDVTRAHRIISFFTRAELIF